MTLVNGPQPTFDATKTTGPAGDGCFADISIFTSEAVRRRPIV
jgi:hypothetical protein